MTDLAALREALEKARAASVVAWANPRAPRLQDFETAAWSTVDAELAKVEAALARIDALEAEKISLAAGWTKAFWIGIYHQDRAKALEAALRAIRGRVALGGATLKDDIQRLVDKALAAPPPPSPAGAGSAEPYPTTEERAANRVKLEPAYTAWRVSRHINHFPLLHEAWRAGHTAPPPAIREDVGERDTLGRAVREAWVTWAKTQPNPKPSWLAPYDDLAEPDKEADRQIGEALFRLGQMAANAPPPAPEGAA